MIESPQNPKVRQARALRRRRERVREGRLFVEGLRLVEDALARGAAPELLFFTRAALAHERIGGLVEAHRVVAWEVAEPIMAEMAETATPQGVAAIVPLPTLPWPTTPTLLLVPDGVRDPGNLGTLIRAAAGAGVEGVLVPKGAADPWGDKVLRAGMGAHFRVPIRDGLGWDELLPLLDSLTVRLADAAGTIPYDQVNWTRPTALIVGGEAIGAGEAARQRTDETLYIPMAATLESLNAAIAGSVMLFEAARQRRT